MQIGKKVIGSFFIYVLSFSICLGGDSLGLNRRVVSYGRSNLNKTVNNGNCWVFPRDALMVSGGRFPGPGGHYKTSTFGRQIYPYELTPGDIIFFQYSRFTRNGRTYFSTGQFHYAIIENVSGYTITLLHQNFSGRRFVTRATVNLFDMVGGGIYFFRPQTL